MNEMIKALKQAYRRIREHQKENERLKETDAIVSSFKVKELNGFLYLTCNGTPFERLSPNITTHEIETKLQDARRAALHFHSQSEIKQKEEYQSSLTLVPVFSISEQA